ncbi:MAG TPA: hypothetical protein VK787_13975 [Puia sp.]|jgi:hypothetical protein|nr:hypothetical protein [Puia sp.]
MSIILSFTHAGFTTALYDEAIKKLEAAGAAAPKGRTFHAAYGDTENLSITDVWDSAEDFQAFGATLLPILSVMGIDPGMPTISPVHNTIFG